MSEQNNPLNSPCITFHKGNQSCVTGLFSPLASEDSTRVSLESIRNGQDSLNKHRQKLLARVPNSNDWSRFDLNSVTNKDLAYLSAETGDEFALMRGKNEDVLFHGTTDNCALEKDTLLMDLLKSHKLRLECHSHPDYERIIPSKEDRAFIKYIDQKESKIISSYTGKEITFTSDPFSIM